jgi:hypothetical protein
MSLIPFTEGPKNIPAPLYSWFQSIQRWLGPIGQTGVTSARPNSGVYVGLSYFDTTLGYPVFAKSVVSSANAQVVVWVNASGGVV